MKIILALLLAVGLTSCNTLIGIGRDTREGYVWTKNKIQEKRQVSGQQDEYGAPIY